MNRFKKKNEKSNLYSEHIDTVTLLEYKGLLFDEWAKDEETGEIWGEMCYCCADKYKDLLKNELSSGGIGACSVQGCNKVGYDNDAQEHYYIDFDPDFIRFVEKEIVKQSDIDVQIEKATAKNDLSAKSFDCLNKKHFTR